MAPFPSLARGMIHTDNYVDRALSDLAGMLVCCPVMWAMKFAGALRKPDLTNSKLLPLQSGDGPFSVLYLLKCNGFRAFGLEGCAGPT